MNNPDPVSSAGLCVVCGKDTTGGCGLMNLLIEGRDVPLCCPMCCGIYQTDPARYLTSQILRERGRGLGRAKLVADLGGQ